MNAKKNQTNMSIKIGPHYEFTCIIVYYIKIRSEYLYLQTYIKKCNKIVSKLKSHSKLFIMIK